MKNIALVLALLAGVAVAPAFAEDTTATQGTDIMKGCASMPCCQQHDNEEHQGCCCCKK